MPGRAERIGTAKEKKGRRELPPVFCFVERAAADRTNLASAMSFHRRLRRKRGSTAACHGDMPVSFCTRTIVQSCDRNCVPHRTAVGLFPS